MGNPRTFKSRWFQRFVRREVISDSVLLKAVEEIEAGLIDVNLGGGVVKQRIARPGEGKSKGYRAIIIFRRGKRAFFMYGFSKSQRANIHADEANAFKTAATYVLSLTEEQLEVLIERGDFVEVIRNDE